MLRNVIDLLKRSDIGKKLISEAAKERLERRRDLVEKIVELHKELEEGVPALAKRRDAARAKLDKARDEIAVAEDLVRQAELALAEFKEPRKAQILLAQTALERDPDERLAELDAKLFDAIKHQRSERPDERVVDAPPDLFGKKRVEMIRDNSVVRHRMNALLYARRKVAGMKTWPGGDEFENAIAEIEAVLADRPVGAVREAREA